MALNSFGREFSSIDATTEKALALVAVSLVLAIRTPPLMTLQDELFLQMKAVPQILWSQVVKALKVKTRNMNCAQK